MRTRRERPHASRRGRKVDATASQAASANMRLMQIPIITKSGKRHIPVVVVR